MQSKEEIIENQIETDFNNPQVKALPVHLKKYIVPQNYTHYTAIDQAVWRYVMRQNYRFLEPIAYYPYIPGLEKAGLTIEQIPDLHKMNIALAKFGWGAVTVDGFIPPSVFMEYQAHHVLVIAADIRGLKHIEYTPAPDIIHESSGHAPIIAEPDYQNYLSYFGIIGSKAMFSKADFTLYECIRNLSILKENIDADPLEILEAEEKLSHQQANMGEPSEMAYLSRLHWWTVEYGLIGTLKDPKIYGAGLLSSISESADCLKPEVKKLWYSIEAMKYSYDITKAQPQLFVTPSFKHLMEVLEEYVTTMAFKRGGRYGLQKALDSKNTCTIVLSSGLQISGLVNQFKINENEQPIFFSTKGDTALAFNNQQLATRGKEFLKNGFFSPLGKLKGINKPLELFSTRELIDIELEVGRITNLTFESGYQLEGEVIQIFNLDGKIQLISLRNCSLWDENKKLICNPSSGIFDLGIGEKVVSVFGGAADKNVLEEIIPKQKRNSNLEPLNFSTKTLHKLYQALRDHREIGKVVKFKEVFKQLTQDYPDDWLCVLEIWEILTSEKIEIELTEKIYSYLENKAKKEPKLVKLIRNGLIML